MRPVSPKLFLFAIFILFFFQTNAQSCAGSLGDPVIDENFGAGPNPGLQLAGGITNMTYVNSSCPNDGFYTIANNIGSCFGNTWHSLNQDHTGNPNGYMMVINASVLPSVFFTQTASGLCPNTTYEFAAWILNLDTHSACGGTPILPNITFSIQTTGGTVLQTYNTGDIPVTTTAQWVQYGTYFTTPANASDVIVTMTNNATGGCGNDLALDDITFRACGPIINAGFASITGSASQQLCRGANANYSIQSQVVGNSNPTYQWQSNSNGSAFTDIAGQNADSLNISIVNAVTGVYQYRLGVANGSNISSVQCRVYSSPLTVNVNPLPVIPSLSAKAVCACPALKPNEFCLGDSIQFSNITNPADTSVKTYLWDFGDGITSGLPGPEHLYANPGTYNVTLTVANSFGCTSDTIKSLTVNNKPVAAFTTSAPDCAGQNVTFTDQSTITGGKIVQWIWSYGDGSKTDTLTSGSPFNHIYTNTGTDTIKLTVISDGGCSSISSTQLININPVPVVNFNLPAVCLNDTYAQFTDASTIADSTMSGFTYLWNFGDPGATAANPDTSSLKNPTHKYHNAANYNVTLTVTSVNGCVATLTQPFTVNGDTPVAAFSVENSINLCSSDPVVFDDLSTVNFGNITKIVWYFDYNNNPQDSVVFLQDSIPANLKFYHTYPLFNSPLTKSYEVRMDVYSGITCFSTTQQNITVNANPVVTLSSVGTLCQNAQPVQIVQNTNGFTGSGVFSGTGISSTGLFDPSTTGTGAFTINYTFTAQNGCTYSTSQQVTVNPVPTVYLAPDIGLLEGAQVTLPATATGDSLSYQWTPSTGLNHDNILNPVASPINNTTYKLTVTNAQGCAVAAEIAVNVLKYPVIPNTFTPNGDGINDTWDIQYLNEYPYCTVNIYDRYGQKVFTENGYGTPWDGTYRGAPLPQGTYFYIISPGSGRKVLSGSVTIIR